MSKTQNSPCDPGISPTEFFMSEENSLRKMHEIDLLTDLIEHLRNEPGELYSRGEIIRWLRVVRRKTKNNQR